MDLVKRREELITGQTGLRTLGIAVLRAAVPETHGSNRRQIFLVKPENFIELRKINAFERRLVDAHAGCGEEEEPHADVSLTSLPCHELCFRPLMQARKITTPLILSVLHFCIGEASVTFLFIQYAAQMRLRQRLGTVKTTTSLAPVMRSRLNSGKAGSRRSRASCEVAVK